MPDHIGTIKAAIKQVDALAVGSVLTLACAAQDARSGRQLIVPSADLEVYLSVKERVADAAGRQWTVPENENWSLLFPTEYEMFEEPQPKGRVATEPYTFLFQPTRERHPLFPEIGVYELWLKFVHRDAASDDVWVTFLVKVGENPTPRRG